MRYLKIDPSSGIWQFRYKLPLRLRFLFGVTEITKSLRTNDKRLAIIQSLKKEAEIKEKIMEFEKSPPKAILSALKQKAKKYVDNFLDVNSYAAQELRYEITFLMYEDSDDEISDVTMSLAMMRDKETFLEGIFPANETPHDEAARTMELLIEGMHLNTHLDAEEAFEVFQTIVVFYTSMKKLREFIENGDYGEAKKLSDDIFGVSVVSSVVEPIETVQSKTVAKTIPKTNFDKVLKSYEREKINEGITDVQVKRTLHSCTTVHSLINADDISKVDRDAANQALILCKQLPADPLHKKHGNVFVDLTPLQRIEKNKKTKAPVISVLTANRYIEHCSSFYKWAKQHNYINYNPFEGLATRNKKNKKAVESKAVFSSKDLEHIFKSDREYKMLWQKWVPLIALYSGMRPNEICQLLKSDIKVIHGIWFFDLKVTNDTQSFKNLNAIRKVPIHSKLLEMGILELVGDGSETLLFPELSYAEKSGYYRKVENYWNRHIRLDRWKDEKKSFYSFRHGVSDFYKQNGISAQFSGAILGHENGNITYDTYGSEIAIEKLKDIMEMFTPDASFY